MKRKYGVGNGGAQDGGTHVPISSICKIETDPPIWIIDLEGERVEVDTDTLLIQKKFQQICVEKIFKCPVTINATRWSNMINDILKNAEVIPAPPDAGVVGQFYILLEQFVGERAISKVQDELAIGRTYHNEAKHEIWFRSQDLIVYLETKRFHGTANNKIWAMLRHLGASSSRVPCGSKIVSIWSLPDDMLPKIDKETALPIPRAITGGSE